MSDTVLVTGGAGYIGSHVSKALADSGLTPVCYDTLEKGHEWAVRWGPLERGDIGDAARLHEVFARHKPRAIIHMAGYAEVGESLYQPERYMHNNVTKTGVLVEAALRQGIEALVFSSSCSIYGLPQSDVLDEKHRIAPMSPYAESKARAEVLLEAAATRGLRAASLRYFNAAGADPGGDIGEAHAPAARRQLPASKLQAALSASLADLEMEKAPLSSFRIAWGVENGHTVVVKETPRSLAVQAERWRKMLATVDALSETASPSRTGAIPHPRPWQRGPCRGRRSRRLARLGAATGHWRFSA